MHAQLIDERRLSGCALGGTTEPQLAEAARNAVMAAAQARVAGPQPRPAAATIATTAAVAAEVGDFPEPPTVDETVGGTPLVRLQRLHAVVNPGGGNRVYLKLEGSNPGGSAKDRPALAMLKAAEASGRLRPGGRVIECTTGNTGIALAMMCAARGYRLRIVMPAFMTEERKAAITAYGAELVLVPSLEEGRDLARHMADAGEGVLLEQTSNPANPLSHRNGTGAEVWVQTGGRVTHFVAGMGTSGTLMGVSAALKARNPRVVAIGLEPPAGEPAGVPGIRAWPEAYRPRVRDDALLDRVMPVSRREAEETGRALARSEGLLLGISAAGAVSAALRLCAEVEGAVIVVLACDRGDRYLSTGVYGSALPAPAPLPTAELPSALARLVVHPAPHYVFLRGAARAAVGADAADGALLQAQKSAATAGGTLLVVDGEFDSSHTVARLLLPRLATCAAVASDGPVLVRWRGAELAAAAAAAGAAVLRGARASVLLSQADLRRGCSVAQAWS